MAGPASNGCCTELHSVRAAFDFRSMTGPGTGPAKPSGLGIVSWLQLTAGRATDARYGPGAARCAVGVGLAWPRRRWPAAARIAA